MKASIFKTILFTILFHNTVLRAQSPEVRLENFARAHPIEKVYLRFDREQYLAGETAWFSAFLLSEYFPDTISTNLQVEFSGPGLTEPIRIVLPVLAGTSAGQIEIPDSLRSGTYTVTAFTPLMAEHSPDFIYRKAISIHGKELGKYVDTTVHGPRVYFFPEGGNLVSGLTGTVAFKAILGNGMPNSVEGKIINRKEEVVAAFRDEHDGMGIFVLTPVTGEKYKAIISAPFTGSFDLPEIEEKGIALSVIPHPQGSFFEVQQRTDDPDFMVAYMIGQMQHRLVLKHVFNGKSPAYQGTIDTRHLHSGILQLTVFNKAGIPLAERLVFVNNGEYLQSAGLLEDTVDFSARGYNRFRVSFPDTVQGSFSVAVTDAALDPGSPYGENILSNLLLTSDLAGYVHRPAYYISGNSDSAKNAADLLMMTNGWRRYLWTSLPKQEAPPEKFTAYIALSGKASLRGTNRPFGETDMLIMINDITGSKKRTTEIVGTGKNGEFLIDSLVFFDKKTILFSDVRGKKSRYIDVKLDAFSLFQGLKWPKTSLSHGHFYKIPAGKQWQMDYQAILKEKGEMLEGITVQVKKKSPEQEVDERYTSGMFTGDATRSIDLVNAEDALPYNNIFDYLNTRVNGLSIIQDGPDYGIFYRQGPSVSSMGNIPMTLFLNEIETEASVIATIPANQVALVKLYNSFAGAWGNAPGGVLSIYTKKGDDLRNVTGRTNIHTYKGYSVVKEFYAPDYKEKLERDQRDHRITLDWRPSVFINHVNPRVPFSFYNNDRTGSFRIVVEGMTATGKLIWLEKIVSGK